MQGVLFKDKVICKQISFRGQKAFIFTAKEHCKKILSNLGVHFCTNLGEKTHREILVLKVNFGPGFGLKRYLCLRDVKKINK